jgi:hypothetical protein
MNIRRCIQGRVFVHSSSCSATHMRVRHQHHIPLHLKPIYDQWKQLYEAYLFGPESSQINQATVYLDKIGKLDLGERFRQHYQKAYRVDPKNLYRGEIICHCQKCRACHGRARMTTREPKQHT